MAEGIVDPMQARCLAFDDGTRQFVMVVVDACMIPREIVEEARTIAAKETGIPAERMLISATHTHSAAALNPVFLLTEDGLGMREVKHFPLAKAYDDCIGHLAALYSEEHDFSTVVVDSLDWLEPLIWAEACKRNNWPNIEFPGFGKGYAEAVNIWREYIDKLNALRDEKGMAVLQIAHTDIKRFDSPEHEPYDRYIIKLQARAAALLQEHSDIVLFANYQISITKADVGFSKKVARALGTGKRVMHTEERPAFLAKNRYELPETLPLDWSEFVKAMPQPN